MIYPFAPRSLFSLLAPLVVGCSSPTVPGQSSRGGAARVATAGLSADESSSAAALRAETEVRQLDAAEVQAFLNDDPATLARLWSDEFVVTNPFNQFLRKRQVMSLVTSGTLAFSSYVREIEYVRAYQDVVIVAGAETVRWAGTIPLAGQTSRLRYTAVWARHGNEWQEVARHASFVLPGGPSR